MNDNGNRKPKKKIWLPYEKNFVIYRLKCYNTQDCDIKSNQRFKKGFPELKRSENYGKD